MTTKAEQPTEEGPRSFAHFLQMLDGGQANTYASEELLKLTRLLRAEARHRHGSAAGKVTLEIDLKCDETGTVDATYGVKVKEPKRRSSKSIFWLTRGGNLTPENPMQQKLPLREIAGGNHETRDVGDRGAVREV